MKVSFNVEMDVNEINASFNALKDLLSFIVAQKRQDDVERKLADLESRFIVEKTKKWWNEEDTKQKNNCK